MRACEVVGDEPANAAQRLAPALGRGSAGRGLAHVLLGDPPVRPRAGDRAELDAEVLRDLPHERRRPRFLVLMSTWPVLGADHHEQRADRDDVAFRDEDPADDPGGRGRDLDRRLVGLDLDQRVVLGDLLPHRDEPARDLALGEALAQIGKPELVRHQNAISRRTASATRATDGM